MEFTGFYSFRKQVVTSGVKMVWLPYLIYTLFFFIELNSGTWAICLFKNKSVWENSLKPNFWKKSYLDLHKRFEHRTMYIAGFKWQKKVKICKGLWGRVAWAYLY